ncbi:MAG: cytidylyltransferase domain-containing protein [Promethearchaeia archaeon]
MLALIPARGGSKGIKKKNIADLGGKPLIYYTINAAFNSKKIHRIIVSTDDDEIAKIVKKFGAEIPFMRPKYLATDTSRAVDTYIFTIDKLSEIEGIKIEEYVVLQPTTPFKTAEDIDNAISIFLEKDADFVIGVQKAPYPPQWFLSIDSSGILRPLDKNSDIMANRQEHLQTYIPNGTIFVIKTEVLKKNRTYYTNKTYPYLMPRIRSLDIDDYTDLLIANVLLDLKKSNKINF